MAKLSHRGVCVSDFEASDRFYREGLGFEEHQDFGTIYGADMAKTMELDSVELRCKMLKHPSGPVLELLHFRDPPASGPRDRKSALEYGLFHLSFYVDDIDEAAERIRAAGGTVHEHTRSTDPASGLVMLYCTDPDGVRIELMRHPDVPARFSHSGVGTDDIEASLQYYAALGFLAAENFVLDDGVEYLGTIMEVPGIKVRAQMIRDADGNTVELLKVLEPAAQGSKDRKPLNRFGLTHMAFWDDDMEGTIATLSARGGYFVEAAHVKTAEIELQHGADPNGVRIELMRPVTG